MPSTPACLCQPPRPCTRSMPDERNRHARNRVRQCPHARVCGGWDAARLPSTRPAPDEAAGRHRRRPIGRTAPPCPERLARKAPAAAEIPLRRAPPAELRLDRPGRAFNAGHFPSLPIKPMTAGASRTPAPKKFCRPQRRKRRALRAGLLGLAPSARANRAVRGPAAALSAVDARQLSRERWRPRRAAAHSNSVWRRCRAAPGSPAAADKLTLSPASAILPSAPAGGRRGTTSMQGAETKTAGPEKLFLPFGSNRNHRPYSLGRESSRELQN